MVQGWVCAQLDGCEVQGKTMKELCPLHKEVIKLERFPKALLDHKPSRDQFSKYSLPSLAFDLEASIFFHAL